jgi:hypothetical protein
MLTGKYRRIYHHHLPKCGGATLNRWLDTLTFDERCCDAEAWNRLSIAETCSEVANETLEVVVPSLARTMFHWSDVVYSHLPLRVYVPENTFCVTVLRDPVQRLVSQVSHWRRLGDADAVGGPPHERACIEDSRRLPLREFLEKHGQRGGRMFLDNAMTRTLAGARIGNPIGVRMDPDRLGEVALQSLEKDYDLIGLTEEMDLSRNALCAMVGLPPARGIPTLNASDPDLDLCGVEDVLSRLTRVDRVIYERARQLFDQRHRQIAESYDTGSFETHHAGRLLAEARGCYDNGATRYSVRAPIIGAGFHGRDARGTSACAVWSGPDTRSTLYVPTPPNIPLSLLVWVRGYAGIRQRDQLRVRVDGVPVEHRFECADNYADVVAVDTVPAGDFVRLEIDLDETLESGDPASGQYDERKRGFSFDSYGWRPVTPDSPTGGEAGVHVASWTGPESPPDGIPGNVFALVLEAEAQFTGWYSREKALVIAETILRERPRICVGVGVCSGRSLLVCAAALRNNGTGTAYGIDPGGSGVAIEAATNGSGGECCLTPDFGQIRQELYRFITAMNLTTHVRLIEAPSGCAATLFNEIDFLHIDGTQSFADAAEDVIAYLRKVRPGGIVVLDDAGGPLAAVAQESLAMLCETVTVLNEPETGRAICAVLRRR